MSRVVSLATCNFRFRPIASFDEFADHVAEHLDAADGADLVVFPELFTIELFTLLDGWQGRQLNDLYELDGYTSAYRKLFIGEAKSRNQYIAAGSHVAKIDGRYFNAAHLFGPDGSMRIHAKTHIFPGEQDWLTEEGDAMDAIELPFAKVGFNICYEAEIPECATSLVEQGVEIILSPSFTWSEHGFWRVRYCGHSRCIENQVYFVHSCLGGDAVGPLPGNYARSSILSPCDAPWAPDGVVAQADANREMCARGTVDLDRLHENRQSGAAPTYRDRRRRAHLYPTWPSHSQVAGQVSGE